MCNRSEILHRALQCHCRAMPKLNNDWITEQNVRHQAIILTSGGTLLIIPLGTINKLIPYARWETFCVSLSVYTHYNVADQKFRCLQKSSKTQCTETFTDHTFSVNIWWRHQMETFSALLAVCEGNSLVTGEFPSQRPVTRSFDVFCDLRLNKRLSKQPWGWWFETPSRSLWRHCNVHHMKTSEPYLIKLTKPPVVMSLPSEYGKRVLTR